MEEEIVSHLFYYYTKISRLISDCMHFSQLTPHTMISGFHNIDNDIFLIQNHIPFLFKLYI